MRLKLSLGCLLSVIVITASFMAADVWNTSAAQKPRAEKKKVSIGPKKRPGGEKEEKGKEPRSFDNPGEAAEFYRRKRVPEPSGQIPAERYFTAQQQMRAMPRYATATSQVLPPRNASTAADERLGTWVPLGPGNIGGRTRAFIVHPTNPNVMYAAGVAGGVWKSTNGGGTWTPLTDLIANLSVAALAMDPKNPEILYAGTGEGYGNFDSNRGAGIFKTTDGGATWARLAATTTTDFYYVNDLVISPNSSERIYAATRTGRLAFAGCGGDVDAGFHGA